MPYHEPDPSDPSMLIGTGAPCGEQELREMAGTFADELARMGHDETSILCMFRRPFYAGPHLAWRSLGDQATRQIVLEAVAFWSRCPAVVKEADR